MRSIPAVLFSLLLATPASAAHIYLSADTQPNSCGNVTASTGSVVDLYVMFEGGFGESLVGAQFRVTAPACPGVSLVGWTAYDALVLGDPESGISIAVGGCVGGELRALLKLQYLVANEVDCCEIDVLPHPQAETGHVEFVTCLYATQRAWVGNRGFISTNAGGCEGYSPPPRDPSPADGATDVSVSLSWPGYQVDGAHSACPLPLCYTDTYELYFGTEPDPPLVYTYMCCNPTVGPLQPETTYYWRVVVINCGFFAESPVWSFTTENTTPVESKTWGAVKALYR